MANSNNELTAVSALEEFQAVMARVLMNETFGQTEKDALHDIAVIKKIEDVIRAAKKKADQDLLTYRQIKGEDYLPNVKTFRKPRENKAEDNPLAEFNS